jgi:hypothetical protein
MTDKEDFNIDDLRWVRVFTPIHIPKQLIEQVRDRDYSVEDFYKYQEINCLRDSSEGTTLNPFSHLYVLADKENLIRGFLWFTIDALSKDICIQTYSVEKNYWEPGKAVKKVTELLKEIKNKANLNKVYWITNYPKHSKRYGFKESKSILMEYSGEEKQLLEEKGE